MSTSSAIRLEEQDQLSDPDPPFGTDPRCLLRVKEAADFLRISASNMHKLLAAGEVRSVTIGVSRRVPLLALHEYVDRLLTEAEGAVAVTGPEYNRRA